MFFLKVFVGLVSELFSHENVSLYNQSILVDEGWFVSIQLNTVKLPTNPISDSI